MHIFEIAKEEKKKYQIKCQIVVMNEKKAHFSFCQIESAYFSTLLHVVLRDNVILDL